MTHLESLKGRRFADLYRGRRVLVIGSTGFLGSVTLSLLMHELESLERLYVLVRKVPGQTGESRFKERVLPGAAFDPVRDRFGDRFEPLLAEKLRIVQGDISQSELGFDAETLAGFEREGVDLVLNGSGLVDFHAPLEQAYKVNILGTRNLIGFCRRFDAALVHTSTCYVAGSRTGRVAEAITPGAFPRQGELAYVPFVAEQEVADIETELELTRQRSLTLETRARLTEQAVTKFREVNGCDPTESQLANGLKRAQRDWLQAEGVEAGRRRAAFWGWPNVYTYSKSIAEQLLATSGIRMSVVRPAIIESALAYPLPGWNQNATTSAPLVMLALAGFDTAPAVADHVLDMVPVDQVAWALLAAGGATLAGVQQPVYQVGTSDTNALTMRRTIDLIGLYVHERALDDGETRGVEKWLAASKEPRIVDSEAFKRRAGLVDGLSRLLGQFCEARLEEVHHHRVRALLEQGAQKAADTREELDRAIGLWNVFMPFSHDYSYQFETAHVRALAATLAPDAAVVPYAPEAIDWRHYWLSIHIPGLQKWVLAESSGKAVKPVPAATTLLARLEGVAAHDGYRQAIAYMVGGRPFALTYGALWQASARLAEALSGLEAGATLGVVTDAAAPWPIALVAALRAGHPVVLIRPRALPGAIAESGVEAVLAVTEPTSATLSRPGAAPVALNWELSTPASASALATHGSHPTVGAWAEGEAGWGLATVVDARTFADRLRAAAELWELTDRDTALVLLPEADGAESDAIALFTLAALYQQAGLDVAAADGWPELLDGLAPTTLLFSQAAWRSAPEAWSGLSRVARVLDCDPVGRHGARSGLVAHGVAVVQPLWDPSGLAVLAARKLAPKAEPGAFTALAPWRLRVEGDRLQVGLGGDDWRPTPWHAHALEAGFRLDGDGATGRDGRVLAMLRAVGQLERVALLCPAAGESGRRALVVPVLDGTSSFQPLRRRLLDAVRSHNAEAPLPERITRLGVTLADWAGDPEAMPAHVLWLDARQKVRFDETPDPEALLEDDMVLFAGAFGPDALANALAPLRDAALTYERLLAWERTMLRAAHEGGWTTQALIQGFALEDAKHARFDYRAARVAGALIQRVRDWTADENPTAPLLPEPVSEAVRQALGKASMAAYKHGLDVTVRGGAYVPPGENFLVVANHASHLDGGLVKYAIGAWGDRLHTLAAKDYFFGTPARRLLAHHFTRLIPTDRQKITSEWLRRAREVLAMGDCVLIFPEGTRGTTDELQPFKASLGTLVRTARVPVLPVHIEGTREILPKGEWLPRGRAVTVHVGPPIPVAAWDALGVDRGTMDHDKAIASYIQRAVEALPKSDLFWLDDPALRRLSEVEA